MADISLEQYYINPEPEVICGEKVPSISDSHNFDYDNYPSVVERYYTKYYYFRNDNINEAHTLLSHSNGICLVGLANTHIAVRKGIKSLSFDVGNFDRSKNQVSGKGKRGAMNLQNTSCLAVITCEDESEYRISSTIQGKLIEVNERLLSNPKLIGQDGHGYIAIVLPKLERCKELLEKLATEEEYKAKLKQNTDDNSIQIQLDV